MSQVYIGLLDQLTMIKYIYSHEYQTLHTDDSLYAVYEFLIKERIHPDEDLKVVLFAQNSFEINKKVLNQRFISHVEPYDSVYRVNMQGSKIENCSEFYIIVQDDLDDLDKNNIIFMIDNHLFNDIYKLYINYLGEKRNLPFILEVAKQFEDLDIPEIIEIYPHPKVNLITFDIHLIEAYDQLIEKLKYFIKSGHLNDYIDIDENKEISFNCATSLKILLRKIYHFLLSVNLCKCGNRDYILNNSPKECKEMILFQLYDVIKTTRSIKHQIRQQNEIKYSNILKVLKELEEMFYFIRVRNDEQSKYLYDHYYELTVHIVRWLSIHHYYQAAITILKEVLINQIYSFTVRRKLLKYRNLIDHGFSSVDIEIGNREIISFIRDEFENKFENWLEICQELDSNQIEPMKIMSKS